MESNGDIVTQPDLFVSTQAVHDSATGQGPNLGESHKDVGTTSLILAKHLQGYVYGPYPTAGKLKISARTSG